MKNKVTAVLLRWKRHDELREIEAHLRTFPFIGEVIIWDNTRGENFINFGRYLAAAEAENETIYTQDDDCIIENVEELFNVYESHNRTKLVNGMKRERMAFYRGRDSMMGWGGFFERSWVSCLTGYVHKYGRDQVFYRETDRIFTSLLRVERVTMVADVRDFPSAMAGHSLSLQGDHENMKSIALHRCLIIGRENHDG